MKRLHAMVVLSAVTAMVAPAQTFTTLATFNYTNGASPRSSLVQGLDGNLYGTAYTGGANNNGTVFKVSFSGVLTAIYSFGTTGGANPYFGLALATDGTFYGSTSAGGGLTGCLSSLGCGTLFHLTADGTVTTIHNFSGIDGDTPGGVLLQATDGNFYGVTEFGGTSQRCFPDGCGTFFQLKPSGAFTSLYSFGSTTADPEFPEGGLVESAGGLLYGSSFLGGAHDSGAVYEIGPGGILNTLYGFGGNSNDALNPLGGLTSGGDGNFYGASQMGGGTLCQDNGCGAAFRITPAGNENVLTSLTMTQGDQPYGTLILGTDGNFYGTAIYGGSPVHRVCGSGCGTVFRFTRAGVFTTLHRFEGPDGEFPNGGLVQGTDGNFYGTTFGGGLLNEGTIYKLSLGLSPFVKALPYAGPVGGNVTLLGTDLTGATSVKFNGAEAAFTVVSPTEISTTVPAGGTTGSIAVVTPGGTLFSGFRFTVR